MVAPRRNEVNGIAGWLLLLCFVLLVWQPVSLALTAVRALEALEIRGLPLALVVLGQILVAGFGIAAGLALISRRRGAPALAKWSLVLSAAADMFVYATHFLPNNRLPGTTPLFMGASLVHYGIWLAYLTVSRRVRDTFPT